MSVALASSETPLPSQQAAYADLFERLLDPTFLIDLKTFQILEANPAAERVLNKDATYLVGCSILDFVEPVFQESFEKDLRVAGRRHHPRLFESSWRLDVGEIKLLTVELSACALELKDGVDVLQLIVRDITFKREAEKKMQQLLKDLQAANEKLEALSTIDEMTQLPNFRFFKHQLSLEHTRAMRASGHYAIVFTDIDFFKKYNDRNGHPAGDDLLRRLAKILAKNVRAHDLPARYGGEEFVVLCPGIDWRGAATLAERLKQMVAETEFPHGGHQPNGRVSISVGVASFPQDGSTIEEVLEAADQAMYYSKTHGKNQVTTSQYARQKST